MLEHLQPISFDPAPFRPQPIRGNTDERAIPYELERRACQSLRKVLQLKLQQRTRELIMPPLKSPAAFNEQRSSLERARTDNLKRKIRSEPKKSKLIKLHISDVMTEETLLQPKQLELKKACLGDDLNNKLARRPGPMELIHKNILPAASRIKQVNIGTQLQKASKKISSCDEGSDDSLSPSQLVSKNCPLDLGSRHLLSEKMSGSHTPSPPQALPSALPFHPISCSPLNLSKPVQRTSANTQIKPKINSDRFAQKYKKAKDNKPKLKKLKYHQYIHPDQKGDKEPLPSLDSSVSKILQQQQLFLQLQILSLQQQNNIQTIQLAPHNGDQKPSSPSVSISPLPRPAAVPSTTLSNQHHYICFSSASVQETLSLQPNLDGMKVAELKSELKLRSLPVSGTRKDLIERLRAHQELNPGTDATSSLTAGGTTEPEPERAAASSENTNNYNDRAAQEQHFQHHRTSPLNVHAGTSQRALRHGGSSKLHIPQCKSPSPRSSNCSSFGEQTNPHLTELSQPPSSVPRLPANIKEEPSCSTPAPCQFSLKSASLHKQRSVSPAAPAAPAAASSLDKDRMLQEKDKQIAELTRMLRQKQRLVEELKVLLEKRNREAQAPEPQIPPRVKEKPSVNSDAALSASSLPLSLQILSAVIDKVTIKQEAVDAEAGSSEAFVQTSVGLQRSLTRAKAEQNQIRPQLKPETTSLQNKREPARLQRSALQLVQQQAVQKLLLQQQHNIHSQTPGSRLCRQQGQKKSQKLRKQQQQMEKQSKQWIQTETHLKQQQVSQPNFKQQSRITPHILPDLLKHESNPTLVWNESHFLIPPNNSTTREQRNDSETQNGAHQESVEQPQQGAAPPRLQSPHARKKSSPPPQQTKIHPHLDVLLSPVFPAKTETSPSDDKDRTNEVDLFTFILQAGETTFGPLPDPSLDRLSPDFSPPSSPPSPLQFLMSLADPPSCDTMTSADAAEQKQHLRCCADGRLEDFLESTTGKPLLGVEPGGMLTLIDDLHSQLLCTPSIVDNPSAPMGEEEELGLGSTDWLDLTMGEEKEEGSATLAPLAPETPLGVFSADFLDSSDLHTHWDSSL